MSTNIRMVNEPCRHCLDLKEEHVDEKCLFQPTKYLPVTLNLEGVEWAIREMPYDDGPPDVIYMVWLARFRVRWLARFRAGLFEPASYAECWRFTLSTSINDPVYLGASKLYRSVDWTTLSTYINERVR